MYDNRFQSGDSETDNGSGEDVGDGTNVSNIALPKDYDSVLAISDLESINGFAFKSNSAVEDPDSFNAGLVMVTFSNLSFFHT